MSDQIQPIRTIDVPDLAALGATLRERLNDISDKLAAKIIDYEQRALEHAEMLDAISITDASSYEVLSARLREGTLFLDETGKFFEPWRELFYNPYNSLLTRRKSVESPVENSIRMAKSRLVQYDREQKQKAETEARIAADKQRKAEEERKLELAAQAETAGMSEQAVQQILTAPSTAPTPIVQPATPKVTGQSARSNWCAELFDLHALVKAAAKDKSLLPFLEFNQTVGNQMAKVHKTELASLAPGVRAVDKGTIAVRR